MGSTINTKQAAKKNEGIYVMRPNKNDNIPHINETQNFGNPWSHGGYQGTIKTKTIQEAANNYEQWLNGTGFKNIQQEKRNWIIKQINNGLFDNKNLLYFKGGYKSHADILLEFIKNNNNFTTIIESRMIYTKHFDGENLKAAGAIDRTKTNDVQEDENVAIIKSKKIIKNISTTISELLDGTFALNEKVAKFKNEELDDLKIHVKKLNTNNFSIAISNKGTNIFNTLTAVMEFQRRDLNSNEIYISNPDGYIFWDSFLNSNISKSEKAKIIIDNKYNITIGTLLALQNKGIEIIHLPERYAKNLKKEFSTFLKTDFSNISWGTIEKQGTVTIKIKDLLFILNSKNKIENISSNVKNELLTDTEEEATQAYNDWLTTDKYANNTELEKKKKAAQKVKKEVKKITDIEKPTLSIEFKDDEFFISEDDSLIKALEQTEIETDYDDLNQLIKCIWG